MTPEAIFGPCLVAAIDAGREGWVRVTHPSGASVEVSRHAHAMRVLVGRVGVCIAYDASARTVTFANLGQEQLSVRLPPLPDEADARASSPPEQRVTVTVEVEGQPSVFDVVALRAARWRP